MDVTDSAFVHEDVGAWIRPTAVLALRSIAAQAMVLLAGLVAVAAFSAGGCLACLLSVLVLDGLAAAAPTARRCS